jgi:hypothetical protein
MARANVPGASPVPVSMRLFLPVVGEAAVESGAAVEHRVLGEGRRVVARGAEPLGERRDVGRQAWTRRMSWRDGYVPVSMLTCAPNVLEKVV